MKRNTASHGLVSLAVAAVAVLGLTWATASIARADDFVCTGSVGVETKDNLFVPDGASCTLNGTVVEGNIVVGTGATLQASGAKVDGNIQAEGAAAVTVDGNSTVGGSIQIKQGGSATVAMVAVTADIQFFQNMGPLA